MIDLREESRRVKRDTAAVVMNAAVDAEREDIYWDARATYEDSMGFLTHVSALSWSSAIMSMFRSYPDRTGMINEAGHDGFEDVVTEHADLDGVPSKVKELLPSGDYSDDEGETHKKEDEKTKVLEVIDE